MLLRHIVGGMSNTRLTPDVELDGLPPDEAFAILGNEIRVAIIRALWHADAARREGRRDRHDEAVDHRRPFAEAGQSLAGPVRNARPRRHRRTHRAGRRHPGLTKSSVQVRRTPG